MRGSHIGAVRIVVEAEIEEEMSGEMSCIILMFNVSTVGVLWQVLCWRQPVPPPLVGVSRPGDEWRHL